MNRWDSRTRHCLGTVSLVVMNDDRPCSPQRVVIADRAGGGTRCRTLLFVSMGSLRLDGRQSNLCDMADEDLWTRQTRQVMKRKLKGSEWEMCMRVPLLAMMPGMRCGLFRDAIRDWPGRMRH